ncbi:hypothetical protein GFS31_16110 [Leptolyngbya sp. BL0902]|nr:hypothetical protein GFS31_16110 [Leptolyngbya sp. BL0902]
MLLGLLSDLPSKNYTHHCQRRGRRTAPKVIIEGFSFLRWLDDSGGFDSESVP